MDKISWSDFVKVDIRVGTVVEARLNESAHKPALALTIDFGETIGILKSSAQITDHYQAETLIGKQVLAVVNFPPKQIGKFMSECLVLGLHDTIEQVILIQPEREVQNGARLM